MNKLQQVSNVNDFDYFGYGDVHMMNAGLKVSEFDLSNFKEKQFYTFRKTKTFEESQFIRYNPVNLINKHYTRHVNDVFSQLRENDLIK